MRILIITDGLGCPRKEIDASKTWTDILLKKWSSKNVVFYTHCAHGLSIKHIDLDYISELSPYMVIIQVGIVDAFRRAFTKVELRLLSSIPFLNKALKIFCSEHHFAITKIRNIHDCLCKDFDRIFFKIKLTSPHLFFIRIAPLGEGLIKRAYNVASDVEAYNHMLEKNLSPEHLVDPYVELCNDEYLLQDGHHLTEFGHKLVFKSINRIIEKELKTQTLV